MKRVFCALLLFFCISTLLAEMRVTNVTVKSHFLWDGKIDITYWLEGGEESRVALVSFMGHDNVHGVDLPAKSVSGVILRPNGGPYTVTWDFAADYPNSIQNDLVVDVNVNVVKEVLCASFTKTYVRVNLQTGESWDSSVGPDLSSDTCRTTELWLRRIPKGTFVMGSPKGEVGRNVCYGEPQHQVTLTQDCYIGVFEMTQRQYELIYGSNPSKYKGDCRPVERISYDDIRGTGSTQGAGWPRYGHAVDEGSFLGRLRAKTGLLFDLPTEAQWEYACRAGTTTALNTGKNLTSIEQDSAMDEAGRYASNRSDGKGGYSQHTKVGSYLPNAWGLYDMHGNVYEWCLDWYDDYPSGAVTDPVGRQRGSGRVLRGGYWRDSGARDCRSAYRTFLNYPSYAYYGNGFRVVCLPQ